VAPGVSIRSLRSLHSTADIARYSTAGPTCLLIQALSGPGNRQVSRTWSSASAFARHCGAPNGFVGASSL
jgi:hypothetical protein